MKKQAQTLIEFTTIGGLVLLIGLIGVLLVSTNFVDIFNTTNNNTTAMFNGSRFANTTISNKTKKMIENYFSKLNTDLVETSGTYGDMYLNELELLLLTGAPLDAVTSINQDEPNETSSYSGVSGDITCSRPLLLPSMWQDEKSDLSTKLNDFKIVNMDGKLSVYDFSTGLTTEFSGNKTDGYNTNIDNFRVIINADGKLEVSKYYDGGNLVLDATLTFTSEDPIEITNVSTGEAWIDPPDINRNPSETTAERILIYLANVALGNIAATDTEIESLTELHKQYSE